MPTKEFFTFRTTEGVELNGWMMKPANFDPNKKYPVIMHQYSGPGSQQVLDQWGIGISVCVDGRGTGGRGAAFEKCTYLFLGVKESYDQAETARYLGTLPYVDANCIGIWGWSYGGYTTLMSMSEGTPVFKAGVAIAAPSIGISTIRYIPNASCVPRKRTVTDTGLVQPFSVRRSSRETCF